MLSGSGCRNANGDGSRLLTWIVGSGDGDGIMRVSGNVGSGIVGCGDGGGVWRFKWFSSTASMILTAVSSMAAMVGDGVISERGDDIVVWERGGRDFSFPLAIFYVSLGAPSAIGCR